MTNSLQFSVFQFVFWGGLYGPQTLLFKFTLNTFISSVFRHKHSKGRGEREGKGESNKNRKKKINGKRRRETAKESKRAQKH